MDIDQVLASLKEAVDEYERRLLAISEWDAEASRGKGEWTRKEILGHLIDSASNNHGRFIRAQFSDDLVFPGYAQEDWVKVEHYNEEAWRQLVQLWKRLNLHLIHVIAFIPREVLTRPRARHNLDQIGWRKVSADQPVTLEYLVEDYAEHMKDHLREIFRVDND